MNAQKTLLASCVIAIVLSACAVAAPSAPAAPYPQGGAPAAPAAAPAAAQQSRTNPQPKYEQAAPAAPAEAPAVSDSVKKAPRPMAQATAAPAGAAGPRPITPNNRVPAEPTSVAVQPTETPVDNQFKDYGVNPFVDAYQDRLSTFSLDVDTASYAVMRRYIQEGGLPPFDSVRAEEYVNYFVQDYAPPTQDTFAIYADGALSPFHNDGSYLMRVGVQGFEVPEAERKPASLTFVIDISGSMDMENRLELVKRSLQLLVDRLKPSDSVSIVVFGDTARVVLGPTRGNQRQRILNAIYSLTPEGSTNTEAGMILGYQMATEAYLRGGTNRVILCSDGVGNVGNTDPQQIINQVKGSAPDDVMLTTIGFGMGNFNDVMMEQLADKGNGFYAYIDTLEESRKLFLDRLTNTLETIAKDAKVQIDFNSDVVQEYRLIGYENRGVADVDFRNDAVDAGELNSGHNATAIYQVKLRPNASGKVASVFLRWQDMRNSNNQSIQEISGDVYSGDLLQDFNATSPRFQMNAVVAQYAEILRQSPYANTTLRQLAPYANTLARLLPQDEDVQEFVQLVQKASNMR